MSGNISPFSRPFAILAMIASPMVVAVVALGRLLSDAFALFAPEPMRFAGAGFDRSLTAPGTALPGDLLNSLRHESAVARRSAARHI